MENPEETHLKTTQQILRYLKDTIFFGLHCSAQEDCGFYSFADADWDKDLDTRWSTSRLLHKIGNLPIDWSTKLQPSVSLSTTKAKYRVLTPEGLREPKRPFLILGRLP
jgi:hypothetical protein